MNLLKNSNFNFISIYIIHKITVLLDNHLIYLKDSIFECFFEEYNRLLWVFFLLSFSLTYDNEEFKS